MFIATMQQITTLFIITLLFINNAYAKCSCNTSTPFMSTKYAIGKSSICAGCEYIFTYPAGYDRASIEYEYGQTISQSFYQNGTQIASCPSSKTCQLTVNLNPSYSLTTVISRQTLTNSYATHGNHQINFNRNTNQLSLSECNNFPELNVDVDDQSGYIVPYCNYEYVQTVGNNFYVNMEFNDTVNVTIYEFVNNALIFNQTNSYIFQTLISNTGIITFNISSSNYVKAIWIEIYPINTDTIDDENEFNTNTRNISIAALVFSVLSFSIILIFVILVKVSRGIRKNKQQNYQQI